MSEKIYSKIFDEVGDQISSSVRQRIRSIDSYLKKIDFLNAVIDQMKDAEANATFQLVSTLPSSGKADTYYIVLNSTSGKYEEYIWNGTAFVKIGLIADEVYPVLQLLPVYHAVDKTGEGYTSKNPSSEGWWENVGTQDEALTQDTKSYVDVYSAVDKEGAGYSSSDPAALGWFESDGADGYVVSQANSVDADTTYYTWSADTAKTYYTVDSTYFEVSSSSNGYSEMNPKHLDWYEIDNGLFVSTTDTSVQNGKQYYVAQ